MAVIVEDRRLDYILWGALIYHCDYARFAQ
jgi:hypothetical protein